MRARLVQSLQELRLGYQRCRARLPDPAISPRLTSHLDLMVKRKAATSAAEKAEAKPEKRAKAKKPAKEQAEDAPAAIVGSSKQLVIEACKS